ncbi:hypothetical protein V9T40_009218 [Parthenolecanium corni]|uniref:BTB domain-containing protein n=1 Tax=Parthenolecanium corni TaxID=536013 RepID=A0AAN9TN52_9HEMI
MGSDRYCLRWNNHQNNLLGVFSQLLQEESLVDVTLACSEGHSIRAHKVVLSACSSYFQSLFIDHPNRHPIIILKDVCFAELRTLVEFMYRGEVNLEYCQLPTFLKTAESLQVKGLAEMTHLRSALSPDREILPAARDGQHVTPDEQPPPTVITETTAIMADLEPLPLVRRRSRSPTDTESSDRASPQQPPTPTPHQLSPSRTSAPTASPPVTAPFEVTSHHRGTPSSQSPMSVSPPPPDTCSTFGDDRSMSPADIDDDVSSTHSGANDLTTSSQRSSPPCLKGIPGSSNFLPVQEMPLANRALHYLLKILPNLENFTLPRTSLALPDEGLAVRACLHAAFVN